MPLCCQWTNEHAVEKIKFATEPAHFNPSIAWCNKSSAVAKMGDRLATIHIGKKWGTAVPLSWGELGPHITQCCLGRSLPPYQMASWSIQPFGHNRHGPKIEGPVPLFGGGGAGSLSNTMWPRPRPISTSSFILIHPIFFWPQYTNVTDRTGSQDRQDNSPIA